RHVLPPFDHPFPLRCLPSHMDHVSPYEGRDLMTPLRQQMIAALQLSGKGERTHQSYVREVHLLAQFYRKSPDRISEQELQRYFLHRKNVDGLAPASRRICYSGLRFFYQHVLQRAWSTLSLLRAHTTHRLPAVLSVEEVKRLLTSATPLHHQVY